VLASLFLTTGDRQYIHQTIIDGNKNGSVITLQDNETLASVIYGFTIQNGKKLTISSAREFYGCGIALYNTSATIAHNVIKNNEAFSGGGIYCLGGESRLYGNVIKYNHSYHAGGGILYHNADVPIFFDTIKLNSIYLNYARLGAEIKAFSTGQLQVIEVDTFTVFNPDLYFILSTDGYSNPMNDIIVNVRNQKIEPVSADLYVCPTGDNNNSGFNAEYPLQSICFAMSKIQPDSLQQRTIHIMPGTYSPSATGERLPIGGRSNIRLSGENMNNTIVDCQYDSYFYSGWYMQEMVIENLTILHGFGAILSPSGLTDGGIQTYLTKNVRISNLLLDSILNASHQCIHCFFSDSVWISNFYCLNSIGEQPNFFIRSMDDFPMHVRIENIRIHGNKYYDYSQLFGGYKNLVLAGGNENDEIVTGKIINAEITNNVSWDTWFSNNAGAGFATSKRARLDVVNATIGGNRDSTNLPGTNSTVESSQINIYNSIFYNNNSPDIYIYGDNNVNDPAEINFHYTLFENGPAGIMDGAGNTIHLPATDLAGNPRIAYGRIDMGAYEFADTTVGIKTRPNYPTKGPVAFPNPFWQGVSIKFTLLKAGNCKVLVHDMHGRLIKTLLDAFTVPGNFLMRWNANNNSGNKIPSGHYIINVIFEGENVGSVKVRRW
jgi:hypothetical protein